MFKPTPYYGDEGDMEEADLSPLRPAPEDLITRTCQCGQEEIQGETVCPACGEFFERDFAEPTDASPFFAAELPETPRPVVVAAAPVVLPAGLPRARASQVYVRFTAGGKSLFILADRGRWHTASQRGRGVPFMQAKHHAFLKDFVIPRFEADEECTLTRSELLAIRWPDWRPTEVDPKPAPRDEAIPF